MKAERNEELESAAMDKFGRHFVSLAGSYYFLDKAGQPFGPENWFNYSGFILSIRDTWHLVTAGHILQDVLTNFKAGRIGFNRCYLVDAYGDNTKTNLPTPFYLEDAESTYVYDDGLDFALIRLGSYYQTSVAANGVLPFSEVDWAQQPQEFEFFWMLGLPKETNPAPTGRPPLLIADPIAMKVHKIARPAYAKLTTYERFYGQLRSAEIADIVGMSGGPIYGFAKDRDGVYQYWVVGIQSEWYPSPRVIAATPIPVLGKIIDEHLSESLSSGWIT